MFSHPWISRNLVYRGIEPSDEDFIFSLNQDAESALAFFGHTPSPPNKRTANDFRTLLLDKCLVAAMICLPGNGETPADADRSKVTPIGEVLLFPVDSGMVHHRHCDLAIRISQEHRNKGYATEALQWILEWAFQRVNLHSVGLATSSWNERAIHVYQKVGFRIEGRRREHRWHDGKYYDHIEFGILEHEWREKYLQN